MADEEPGVSPWVEGFNNKVRLVAGIVPAPAGGSHNSQKVAGVEIALPSGWKTYWRTPGESGVPPEFDFSASENLKSAELLYPAPHRLVDRGGTNFGYKEHVVFPVVISAIDETKPVMLKLKAAFGACKELCIPVEAELQLAVPVDLSVPAAISDSISAALASVPVSNASAMPKVASWSIDQNGGRPKLILKIQLPPDATDQDAFADIADGTYVPMPHKTAESGVNTTYEVDLANGVDFAAIKGKTIRVTLTSSKGNSETAIKIE